MHVLSREQSTSFNYVNLDAHKNILIKHILIVINVCSTAVPHLIYADDSITVSHGIINSLINSCRHGTANVCQHLLHMILNFKYGIKYKLRSEQRRHLKITATF